MKRIFSKIAILLAAVALLVVALTGGTCRRGHSITWNEGKYLWAEPQSTVVREDIVIEGVSLEFAALPDGTELPEITETAVDENGQPKYNYGDTIVNRSNKKGYKLTLAFKMQSDDDYTVCKFEQLPQVGDQYPHYYINVDFGGIMGKAANLKIRLAFSKQYDYLYQKYPDNATHIRIDFLQYNSGDKTEYYEPNESPAIDLQYENWMQTTNLNTNLEFWVTQIVSEEDFEGHAIVPGWFGATEYLGKKYSSEEVVQEKPKTYVSYLVTNYPDYSSKQLAVTRIEIADEAAKFFNLSLKSSAEEIAMTMQNRGYTDCGNGVYGNDGITIVFEKDKITISVAVTNKDNIIF